MLGHELLDSICYLIYVMSSLPSLATIPNSLRLNFWLYHSYVDGILCRGETIVLRCSLPLQLQHHVRNLHILLGGIFRCDLEDHIALVRRDGLFANRLHQLVKSVTVSIRFDSSHATHLKSILSASFFGG
jgi:hypothetical protein